MTLHLVTGGAGFIGSHLVEALVERDEHVRVLDDFSTGRLENLAAVIDRIELIEGDVADAATARAAVNGVSTVFHLAANASVQASVEDPWLVHRTNVDGTLNVLQAAREAQEPRVVYASSTSVYGDQAMLPLREAAPACPLSPYAASKTAGEAYCRAFHASYGLSTVALRFFNVYGPRQDPSSPYSGVISIFAARMAQGQRPTVFGDGQQTRDFVYVADVVQALLAASVCDAAGGSVLNVATGQQTSILELVAVLNRALQGDLAPEFAPARLGEVRFSQGDASRAREILGWEAETSLQEGLAHFLKTVTTEA